MAMFQSLKKQPCFIPYGSTESTESTSMQFVLMIVLEGFIPYGSTESTESPMSDRGVIREEKFHPIRLDREH